MYGHSLIAVYSSRVDAERARDRLAQTGIPADRIRMSEGSQLRNSLQTAPEYRGREGFWHWLFGTDIPEHERTWYQTHLREDGTALSVLVESEAERHRVASMLEEFNPIDFDDAGAMTASPTAVHGAAMGTAAAVQGQEEQVIPVVKEELDVAKRSTERRYRIHTYVVERPVEEAVTLRDERVVIERRPTGTQVVGSVDMPQERDYEVIERHEEPVVAKRAQTEEVVVRKETDERTETVRDTVRETKVDIDKDDLERAGPLPTRNS
jgi:stress response protein YsnF